MNLNFLVSKVDQDYFFNTHHTCCTHTHKINQSAMCNPRKADNEAIKVSIEVCSFLVVKVHKLKIKKALKRYKREGRIFSNRD